MDMLESLWELFGEKIYEVLPVSPFQPYLEQMSGLPHLGYLNWFFPIGPALKIMAAWLTVVGTYYMYSVLLRWLKVIGE